MTMASVGGKLRCPNCLEELDHLINPKELPCCHVFCSPCLESIAVTAEITCSICSKVHIVTDVELLPDSPKSSDDQLPPPSPETTSEEVCEKRARVSCDNCEESADSYCVECDKKLCSRHEKLHEDYFGNQHKDHKFVEIKNYLRRPDFYLQPKCSEHRSIYSSCCTRCYSLKCHQCSIEKENCKGSGINLHSDCVFTTLKGISLKLKEDFEKLFKQCADKITEMCVAEKTLWLELDQLEEKCHNLVADVQGKTHDLISSPTEQSERAVDDITQFCSEMTERAEENMQQQRTQRETLDELRISSQRFLQDNHVVKIIEEKEDRIEQLNQAVKMELDSSPLKRFQDVDLVAKSAHDLLNIDHHKRTPTKLELISTQNAVNRCYSALLPNKTQQSLIVCCKDGIWSYPLYGKPARVYNDSAVTSVCDAHHCEGLIFVRTDGVLKVVSLLKAPYDYEELFRFNYELSDGHPVAGVVTASKNMIVAKGYRSIQIYCVTSKEKRSYDLAFKLSSIVFYSDHQLMISDRDNSCVHMYRIERQEPPRKVWTCDNLTDVHGVCAAENGLIVAKSTSYKGIRILSEQGKLLRSLQQSERIPSWGGITVRRGILAMSCPEQEMLQLFRLS